jgi:hypothetical protein
MKQKNILKITPQGTKSLKFIGEKDGFETGRIYTLVELSKITGIKPNALQKRIGTSNFFNEHHVRPTSPYQNYGGDRLKREKKPKVVSSVFESHIELISAQWLKRKL